MKAMVLRGGAFVLDERPEPVPTRGQILVATNTCGICGTDLHARHHLAAFLKGLQRSGSPIPTDATDDVILGHEFCGEVLDHGPDTDTRFKPGTLVVGLPFVTGPQGADYVGYSNRFPGGFAERMVLTEKLAFAVPNGLDATRAALTEPLAIGVHAVGRAVPQIPEAAVILVVGCGPIGLSVIAALKARGLGPVIGVDYSSARRRVAEAVGADETIDANLETQTDIWARTGAGKRRRAVVFECVGRPGLVQSIIEQVPPRALVVVVGNVLGESSIDQVIAFNKEIDICFTQNYAPAEFGQTLHAIAEGQIDVAPVLTGVVAPEQVEEAFAALATPEKHAKIIISFETGR